MEILSYQITFTAEKTQLSPLLKPFILASHIIFLQQISILPSVLFRNDNIDSINTDILRQFPGEILTFLSADTIKNNNGEGGQDVLMYPVEYLNLINCSGLPLHKLELKKGCPI